MEKEAQLLLREPIILRWELWGWRDGGLRVGVAGGLSTVVLSCCRDSTSYSLLLQDVSFSHNVPRHRQTKDFTMPIADHTACSVQSAKMQV